MKKTIKIFLIGVISVIALGSINTPVSPPASYAETSRTLPDTASTISIWADQLGFTAGDKITAKFIADHFVGSQKLTKNLSDAVRFYNPNFLLLQYSPAYGTQLVNNITEPNKWSPDIDVMRKFVADNPSYGPEEDYYMHWTNTIDDQHRVQHYFSGVLEFYLADIRHAGYRQYLKTETLRRMRDIGFDGTFFDVGYFPYNAYEPDFNTSRGFGGDGKMWYQYEPFNWPRAGATTAKNWNDLAADYWKYIQDAYHAEGNNYFSIVNIDTMITGWYENTYLDFVDGGMSEGWMTNSSEANHRLVGVDWKLSASRVLRYLTGNDKILIAQPNDSGSNIDAVKMREWWMANFLLLKNNKSFYYYARGSAPSWWPEYDIDLGSYSSALTQNINDLLVPGTTSLYQRKYEKGIVLVNPGETNQQYTLDGTYYKYTFSGGGNVTAGQKPTMTLEHTQAMTGTIEVTPHNALILWKEASPTADTTQPTAPANVSGISISSSQINLSWNASTDNVGVTGYKIFRDNTEVASVASLLYQDTGLTPSTTYTYTVSAFDLAGNTSQLSSGVQIKTVAGPADLNLDGVVDQLDFDILKNNFGTASGLSGDLSSDGIIDSKDLGILMSEWTR